MLGSIGTPHIGRWEDRCFSEPIYTHSAFKCTLSVGQRGVWETHSPSRC